MVAPFFKQIYGTAGSACLYFSDGYILACLSIILPRLRNPESYVKLTIDQESWIMSTPFILMFPAQCVASYAAEKFGRKVVITSALFPIMISTILMYVAQDITVLMAAVIIKSFTIGGTSIASIWVAEICSPKYRGFLLNGKLVCYVFALLLPHLLVQFINPLTVLLLILLPTTFGLITSFTTPESPAWLAKKGRFNESKIAFIWFRGHNEDDEITKLIHSQTEVLKTKSHSSDFKSKMKLLRKCVLDKSFIKANILVFVSLLLVEVTGKLLFFLYSYDVFGLIVNDKKITQYCVIVMTSMNVLCTIISCIMLGKLKRKFMLLFIGIPALLIYFSFNAVTYMINKNILSGNVAWLQLLLLFSYFFLRDIGLDSVAVTVASEIYPLAYREVGMLIACLIYAGMSFLQTKVLYLMVMAHMVETFTLIAVIMSLCTVYLLIFLPETFQKTLLDIEEELKYGKPRTRNEEQHVKDECIEMLRKD